jgi:hypothetical protein
MQAENHRALHTAQSVKTPHREIYNTANTDVHIMCAMSNLALRPPPFIWRCKWCKEGNRLDLTQALQFLRYHPFFYPHRLESHLNLRERTRSHHFFSPTRPYPTPVGLRHSLFPTQHNQSRLPHEPHRLILSSLPPLITVRLPPVRLSCHHPRMTSSPTP